MHIILKRTLAAAALTIGTTIAIWFIYNQFHPTEAFKNSYHSILQLAVPAMFIWYGINNINYKGIGIEEVDPSMSIEGLSAAKEKAQATLHLFISEIERNPDNAYIKFPLQIDENTEHIWGYVHAIKEDQFDVSVSNIPHTNGEPINKRMKVPKENVEDWQIANEGQKVRGAYSVIALFDHLEKTKQLTPKMRMQRQEYADA